MKQKHMTIEDRKIISSELNKGSTFREIATILGKDPSTISKEVRKHIVRHESGSCSSSFNDCHLAYQRKCDKRKVCSRCFSRTKRTCWSCGKCRDTCELYQKYTCEKLKKPTYVCNSCDKKNRCSLEKSTYNSIKAQEQYEALRREARTGFAITEKKLEYVDGVVSPLLRKGQSLHHISIHHADKLMLSERTLYTYINNNLFSARNIDMPRTVRMRPRKAKPKALKIDKACRIGRTYDDFLEYRKKNPDVPVREIDSVEGVRGSAVLLTIHFVEQRFQLAFLRKSNNSQSVIDVFEKLYLELGANMYMEMFPLVLGDNGSEFSNPKAIEQDMQGNPRTKMFYCNPSAPQEKGHCENNHEFIRRIIPKGVDLARYTQAQIDLMMSHINSYSRAILGNKSPYEMMEFQYGTKIMDVCNIRKIEADEITLTPELLK